MAVSIGYADSQTGKSYKLQIYGAGDAAILNTAGGDTLTEGANRPGYYVASVNLTQAQVLGYPAQVIDTGASDAIVAIGVIQLFNGVLELRGGSAIVGDEMDLVDTPNATGVGVIQSGLATSAAQTTAQTDLTTLTSRVTSARAGYLDNLNVGGAVASNADIAALNQSASRRIVLTTVGQYERPESGSVKYTVEARTYDGDGAAVNADSTPTLTATGSTDLSANLAAATNPATGVYRWQYTVANDATTEQVRFDISATIASSTFTLSAYSQVVDFVAATWSTTDAGHLTAIYNKLPSRDYLTGSAAATGETQTDATAALTAYDPPTRAEATADKQAIQADIATAQADLDTLTGADGVTLATLQPNYAAAKQGDEMDLVDVPNATAVTAIQNGLATAANQATILNRIGAFTGSGVNTILGFLKAALSKTATLPSDVGGTFDPAMDSQEALQEVTATITAKLPSSDYLAGSSNADGSIKDQVVDALNTDTYAEPGQGAPPATASIVAKIGYLYKAWRNKKTQTSSDFTLYADDGTTADQQATVSDDGTTTTIGEMGTGA